MTGRAYEEHTIHIGADGTGHLAASPAKGNEWTHAEMVVGSPEARVAVGRRHIVYVENATPGSVVVIHLYQSMPVT